jgi:uncharacterized protein (DUF1697 family)
VAHVVFLRAVNVGGTKVFRPAQLATALKHLDVVNIGAAGTFVVRSAASAAAIRQAFVGAMPFEPVLAVRPAREVVALVARQPFAGLAFSKDHRGWVAVLTGRATAQPNLPQALPGGRDWLVRFEAVEGAFAWGQWRRHPVKQAVPGISIEKALGVPVTVRYWETIERIAKILEG